MIRIVDGCHQFRNTKPEMEISFDEEDLAENQKLAGMIFEFDTYIGDSLFQLTSVGRPNMATALSAKWVLAMHGFLASHQ